MSSSMFSIYCLQGYLYFITLQNQPITRDVVTQVNVKFYFQELFFDFSFKCYFLFQFQGQQGFYFLTICHNIFEVPNLGIPHTHHTSFHFWEVGNLSDHPTSTSKNALFLQWQQIQCLLVQGLLYGYLHWCFCPCLAPKLEFSFKSIHLVLLVLGMGEALLSR